MPINCALCGKEFVKVKNNQIYCSRKCYGKANNENAKRRSWERERSKKIRAESPEKHRCIMCQRKRNNEKQKYCVSCREAIRQLDIQDTLSQEHKIIA